MPCRCDHMEPTARETEGARASQYLTSVARLTGGLEALPQDIREGSVSLYGVGTGNRVDEVVAMLCAVCRVLTKSELGQMIMANTRAGSYTLEWWWAKHQEDDLRRHKASLVNDRNEPGKARFEELLAKKMEDL